MTRAKVHPDRVALLHLIRKVDPSTGAVFWCLRHRDARGRSVALQLGERPVITAAQADRLTQDCRFKAPPVTPARLSRISLRRPQTVESLARLYIERHAKRHTKSWAFTEAILERDVLPAWGARPIASICRHEVHDLVDAIVDRGAPIMANRVLQVVRMLWNWSIDRGYLESSPLQGLKSPARQIPRDRVLEDEELRVIWYALDDFSWRIAAPVRLLMLTAQRRSEVAGARWSEFDLRRRIWTIPRERMKMAAAHDVPVTEDAMAVLRQLPRSRGAHYLFPATRDAPGYCMAFILKKPKLDQASGVTGWVFHDLRRTAATRMQAIGVRLEVIEAVLGHRSGSRKGVVGIYQRHRFEGEKREALQAWAGYLRHVLGPAPKPRLSLIRSGSGDHGRST